MVELTPEQKARVERNKREAQEKRKRARSGSGNNTPNKKVKSSSSNSSGQVNSSSNSSSNTNTTSQDSGISSIILSNSSGSVGTLGRSRRSCASAAHLPIEVLRHVLAFVPISSLPAVGRTCSAFNDTAHSEELTWKLRAQRAIFGPPHSSHT